MSEAYATCFSQRLEAYATLVGVVLKRLHG